MTREELMKWRRNAPRAIASFAVVPLAYRLGFFASMEKFLLNILLPAFGYAFWLVYDAMGPREALWNREMDEHINSRILKRIEALYPADLGLSPEEREFLRQHELKNRISGVFWETIDKDQELKDTKPWFFENGLRYSTAFDLFIILGLFGFAYLVGLMFSPSAFYVIVALAYMLSAIVAWYCLIPLYRRKHQALSDEQMAMIVRKRGAAVAETVTEIIAKRRSGRN